MKKWIALVLTGLFALSFAGCAKDGGETTGGNEEPSENTETQARVPSVFTREADYSPRNGVKRAWNDVSSYFCNYGPFQEEMLKYDVAIIDMVPNHNGSNMDEEGLRKLKEAGCWTIAYTTLGEDYALNVGDGLGPGGYASYYLYDSNDMPIPNGDWGSYYTDPAHPAWQQIVLNEVQRLVDLGVDGIFMDTVDSVDRFPETRNGMYNLMMRIREEFPDIKMVLNRGFTVVPTMYEILDGVMFELYSTYLNLNEYRYDMLDTESVQFNYNRYYGVAVVNACRQKKYFPVFALEYYPREGGLESYKQRIYDNDWEYDFIPYLTMDGRGVSGEMTSYDELRPQSRRGIKALSLTDKEAVAPNGDTSADNLAYKGNGAKLEVDSTFSGYNKSALNDGVIANGENFEDLGWQFANWASSEETMDHYIVVELPEPKDINVFTVWWAYDNGAYYISRKVEVQVERDGEWVTVGTAEEMDSKTEILLEGATGVTKVRLFQERGAGPSARRNLMWVSEIGVY